MRVASALAGLALAGCLHRIPRAPQPGDVAICESEPGREPCPDPIGPAISISRDGEETRLAVVRAPVCQVARVLESLAEEHGAPAVQIAPDTGAPLFKCDAPVTCRASWAKAALEGARVDDLAPACLETQGNRYALHRTATPGQRLVTVSSTVKLSPGNATVCDALALVEQVTGDAWTAAEPAICEEKLSLSGEAPTEREALRRIREALRAAGLAAEREGDRTVVRWRK